MSRELHLNLFIHGRGHHEAGWRHPGASQLALTDIAYTVELARKAEAAALDSIFFADQLAVGPEVAHAAKGGLEPLTLLAAVAMATERIGLIATASTTYTEPYNLARQFASLDHISDGRAGWNIVTSWFPDAALNYGLDAQLPHSERYARGTEFVESVLALWESWDADAVLDDRKTGRYADPARIRPIDYAGRYHKVKGPLNIARSPQGRPLLVQAGSSPAGRDFAARFAEAIFTAHLEKDAAQEFYRDIKARAAARGRPPESLVVLPGFSPVIGSTEEEARRSWDELNALSDPNVGLERLSARFGGFDLSHLSLDTPLSVDDFPAVDTVESARSRAETILGLVKRERPTLRRLLQQLSGARGHFTISGTPEKIADVMQDWFHSGAADGFNVMPPVLPHGLDLFVSEVVPILRRRGLYRTHYPDGDLRTRYLGAPFIQSEAV